jgi:tetratricopeptide (TPR) repeat protein
MRLLITPIDYLNGNKMHFLRMKKLLILVVLLLVQQHISADNESSVAGALCCLSLHYKKKGRDDLAQKYFELAVNEGSSHILYIRGCKKVGDGAVQEAKSFFIQSSRMSNVSADVALALLDNDIKRACAFFNKYKKRLAARRSHRYDEDWINNEDQWSTISKTYHLMKDYSRAIKYYKKAIKDGKAVCYYSNLARLYAKQQKYTHAVKYYKKAIGEKEESYMIDNLGKVYYKTGKLDLAEDFYNRKEYPGYTATTYLALINFSRGNIDKAYCYLSKLGVKNPNCKTLDDVKKQAKEQVALKMEQSYLKRVGQAYFYQKSYELALPYLLKAQEKEEDLYDYNEIGTCYLKLNKLADAKNAFEKLLSKDKRKGYYGLAKACEKAGEHDNAIAYCEQVSNETAFFQSRAKALYRIVKICVNQDDCERAESYLERLFEACDSERLFKLAFHLKEKGLNQLAKKIYKGSIMKNKGEGTLHNLGNIYSELGKPDKAIDCWKESTRYGCVQAAKNLLNVCLQRKKYKKVIKYSKIITIMEPVGVNFYNHGFFLEKIEELEKAKKYYVIAANKHSNCAQGRLAQCNNGIQAAEYFFKEALKQKEWGAYYLLSKLYEENGQEALASEYLQKAKDAGVFF